MLDTSNWPISGSFVLACLAYAGASVLAGQMVGARTIEKSGWRQDCESAISEEIEAHKPRAPVMRKTDCNSMFGWLHPEIAAGCWQFGNPDLGGPGAEAAREAERRAYELERNRIERAASEAGSRCDCAAVAYARDNMMALGVYAGTARSITLPSVRSMDAELRRNVNGPICAGLAEAGS